MKQGEKDNKSVLSDDAAIYAKRDTRSGRERFRDLKGAAKWAYFRDYYLKLLLGLCAAAAFLIWVLWSVFGPKPVERLNILISDSPFDEERINIITTDMAEICGLDTAHEKIAVDDTFYLNSGNDYTANMKLLAVVAAKQADVLISPKSVNQQETNGEIMVDLRDFLPKKVMDQLEPYAIYSKPVTLDPDTDQEIVGEEGVYSLNISEYIKKCGRESSAKNPYVVGVVVSCQHVPETVNFICYLFDIDYEMPEE